MYYVERIINGIVHCKTSPDGKWIELSKEALTDQIVRLKLKIIQLEDEASEHTGACID